MMDASVTTLLQSAGWDQSRIDWFPADWSNRQYARLTADDGRTAILLRSTPDDDPATLPGHKTGDWVRVNRLFRAAGLGVPDIYAENWRQGLVLMEDFGTETIAGKGGEAYLAATDALIRMREAQWPAEAATLPAFEDTHVFAALRFFSAFVLRRSELEAEWIGLWRDVMRGLPPCPRIVTHIDCGASNLMWMPERAGTDRIGMLDFQAACIGPFVYDCVNLLDDARIILPDDIKQACISRFCAALSPDHRRAFDAWYPVMAAQFHARVMGQILRLKTEKGRDSMMRFYPGLEKRFFEALDKHETLAPVRDFLEDTKGIRTTLHG